MKRGGVLLRVGVLPALFVCVGCATDDITAPASEPAVRPALLVSDVVHPASATGLSSLRRSETYVALPSGTVPGGVSATVTNLVTGEERSGPMIDGGLDPVALGANEGDEVELVAVDADGSRHAMRAKVPPKRPPVIVRVSPPRGRTDVPLNTVIIVVFSEPMDSTAVAAGLTLTQSGTVVAATLTLTNDGTRAELVPEVPLGPDQVYQLGVSSQVADLSGDPLGEVLEVPFTTAPAVSRVEIEPPALLALPAGSIFRLVVHAYGGDGRQLKTQPVTWEVLGSGPATIANVGWYTTVRSHGVGEVSIEARSGAAADTVTLTFEPLTFVDIDAGDRHTCGLLPTGGIVCWGGGESGQIPAGHGISPLPIHLPSELPRSTLAVGGTSTCGSWDGSVTCWGGIAATHLGGTWPLRPDQLSAGGRHACGVAEGVLLCWGWWRLRQNTWYIADGPVPVDGGSSYLQVASGGEFFCATTDGQVRCSGLNDVGQLGMGGFGYRAFFYEDADSPAAIWSYPVLSDQEFADVVAGSAHACALDPGGGVWCWGSNVLNALGAAMPDGCVPPFGSTACPASAVPVRSPLALAAVGLAAGNQFTCALTAGGQAYCWGRNDWGQLGTGKAGVSSGPAPVVDAGQGGMKKIVAGAEHACGLYVSGKVLCWGHNDDGQLGTGDRTASATPRLVELQGTS